MKIKKAKFEVDEWGLYITPLIGFSWVNNYKTIWFGWLRWLFTIEFE